MRFLRVLVRVCVGLGLLTLAGSYLGVVHPVGDSIAVFRPFLAYGVAGAGAVALLVRLWVACVVCGVTALASVVHIASYGTLFTPSPITAPDAVVYTKNLGALRTDQAALTEDIALSEADIVVLQEVTAATLAALPQLLPDHPYRHICAFSDWIAMVVASRWPVSEGGCTPERSLAYAVVTAPIGPIWVASVHQVWPYPYDQAVLLPDILAAVPDTPMRQIIAGDFNMAPWGHSVRAIMEAGGTQRIASSLPTIEVPMPGPLRRFGYDVPLTIDHVLTDGQGVAIRRARLGSDHYGIVARIVWD